MQRENNMPLKGLVYTNVNKSISPYAIHVLLNYAHIMCGISLQTNIITSGENSLQKYLFSSFKQLVTIDYHAMHIWPFLSFFIIYDIFICNFMGMRL